MSASLPPVPTKEPALPSTRPGWKTYAGALLIILGALCHPDVLAVLPQPVAQVLQAIGAALGLIGLRSSQAVAESKTDLLIYNTQTGVPHPLTGRRQ